eukprot:tig00021537_g22298.t1
MLFSCSPAGLGQRRGPSTCALRFGAAAASCPLRRTRPERRAAKRGAAVAAVRAAAGGEDEVDFDDELTFLEEVPIEDGMMPDLSFATNLGDKFCSAAGTRRFSSLSQDVMGAAEGHFRQTTEDSGSLLLSSFGVGTYLGEMDDATDALVENAIVKSVDTGCLNVVDTAINYRMQRGERTTGRALRDLIDTRGYKREEIFVCTKNGYMPGDSEAGVSPREFASSLVEAGVIKAGDLAAGGAHCMSPAFLEDQLARSLANLQLECVDVMYLHNCAEAQIPDVGPEEFKGRLRAAFEFLEGARADGRIRSYGMATWDCFRTDPKKKSKGGAHVSLEEAVLLAFEVAGGPGHGFRYLQLPLNAEMPEAATEAWQRVGGEACTLLEAADRLGVNVFSSVPLFQGRLLEGPDPFPPGEEMGLARDASLAQKHLQFVRSVPGRTFIGPVVGHKSAAHAAENYALSQASPLPPDAFFDLCSRMK